MDKPTLYAALLQAERYFKISISFKRTFKAERGVVVVVVLIFVQGEAALLPSEPPMGHMGRAKLYT
jgi:hypothetical protein